MTSDGSRQLTTIQRGMTQLGLRLNRVINLLEQESAGPRSADSGLDTLLELLDAVDATLSESLPSKRTPWWRRLFAPEPVNLEGLRLARTHAVARLELLGFVPSAASGEVDPRLHHVVAVRSTQDPALDGHIAEVHVGGWTAGGGTTILRLAKVTAWRLESS